MHLYVPGKLVHTVYYNNPGLFFGEMPNLHQNLFCFESDFVI